LGSAALLTATAALADPSGSRNSLTFPANCNGSTVMLVVNSSNGQGSGSQNQNTAPFSPAHVVGSNAIFHPTVFDLQFTFTFGGETMSSLDTNAMQNPKTPVACTINFSAVVDPAGDTLSLNGTVWGWVS
jgi:hypothetical protein